MKVYLNGTECTQLRSTLLVSNFALCDSLDQRRRFKNLFPRPTSGHLRNKIVTFYDICALEASKNHIQI